jgi:AraC-like DNA-binding protein
MNPAGERTLPPFRLPEAILADPPGDREELAFHSYSAPMGAFSGRSVLSRNAISLVIQGEKTIHFAEKRVEIKAGEIHFLSTGNCLVTMDISESAPFRSILVFFGHGTLDAFYRKYARKIAGLGVPIPSPDGPEPFLAFRKDPFIDGFIASLETLLRSVPALSAEMKTLKFEELMLYLLEKHPRRLMAFQAFKSRDPEDATLRLAVETNVTSRIGLEELAYLCNLSLSTFKRRFLKMYGEPPNQWILKRRMEIARDLLARGAERPSEVYHKVGYRTHSSFTQSFKQVFGMTPKEYLAARMDDRRQLLDRTP